MIDFDWKVTEVWLRGTDGHQLFKIDPESPLGKEIVGAAYHSECFLISGHGPARPGLRWPDGRPSGC
jgi:hypothetical protein